MYCLEGRVRYSETDKTGKLTLPALINYLQDCCTFQSEDLKVGWKDYLSKHHLGWFLEHWEISLKGELPELGEKIYVKTWPYKFRGPFGYRQFTVENEEHQVLVEVDSLWFLVDLKEEKPVRITETLIQAFQLEEPLDREWEKKKRREIEGQQEVFSTSVEKYQIDTNGHMNNEKYITLAEQALPEQKSWKSIYVEYKKAAKLNDNIVVTCAELEGGYQICLKNKEGNSYALAEWKGV